ncbi:histidinol-phosphatase (PHP family) [Thermosyntropha lipolytica DSM 11003]|uniref:Histidinol-phosphatase n=1 Tax=Thermosyntropha lipolytica DSM 11003 TaxID=1123382 RepID=A0A1M5QT61_9FIRM|nr:histidinol-phosphatase HisJ family protein [Thermosyntropha lipolytica]SHH17314.1 histidinol-phosphatase (PHP family) [Thermosyntropha lipolytica DSM 11003]
MFIVEEGHAAHLESDYHIHSSFSADSNSGLELICFTALRSGIREIGITDHLSFNPHDPNFGLLNQSVSSYIREIEKQRKRFAPRLNILTGVEIDYAWEKEKEIASFLSAYSFDYHLFSIHHIDGISLMDRCFYEKYAPEEGIKKYIDALKYAVLFPYTQIIAHIDWIKRGWQKYWLDFPYHSEILLDFGLDGILKTMADRGIILEINTSGYRREGGEAFPAFPVLCCYRDVGGKYCILGSDAHQAGEIAYRFAEAHKMAAYLGLQLITPGYLKKVNNQALNKY